MGGGMTACICTFLGLWEEVADEQQTPKSNIGYEVAIFRSFKNSVEKKTFI